MATVPITQCPVSLLHPGWRCRKAGTVPTSLAWRLPLHGNALAAPDGGKVHRASGDVASGIGEGGIAARHAKAQNAGAGRAPNYMRDSVG